MRGHERYNTAILSITHNISTTTHDFNYTFRPILLLAITTLDTIIGENYTTYRVTIKEIDTFNVVLKRNY